MSLASIATNLYTIQSRKNVPLKTAFSMMVREDMAMRFSVYNLVRIITKSEFLATVAQTAYGKRTPMQKAQDEEDRKREMNDQKFKVYTQVTFARINNRLNLLTSIAERNSQLIMNLYSELGYFRGQRKMSFNSSAGFATRVMLPSKTVKTKIEEIEKQLYELSNVKKTRVRPRGAAAKKKTGAGAQTNQDESGLLSSLLPILARNPSALAAVAGVAGAGIGAIGLGTLAAAALTSGGRITDRLQGKTPKYYDDDGKEITNPLAETTGQLIDPGLVGVGAGVLTPLAAVGVGRGARVIQRRALENKIANRTAQIPLERQNERRLFRAYQQDKDLNAPGLQQTAEQRDKALKTRAERMRKQGQLDSGLLSQWAKLLPVLRGLSKFSVGLGAADVAFTVGEMSNHVANRASGKMNEEDFKKKMTTGYAQLISTVGITGFTTAIGAAAGAAGGTLALPFIGTLGGGLAGGIVGGITGGILAIMLEEDEGEDTVIRDLGERVFELIHEGKVPFISPAVTPPTSAQGTPTTAATQGSSRGSQNTTAGSRGQSRVTSPTGPRNATRAVRNNNPGNIEFANQREAVGSDGRFAIFPTREAGLRALETQIRLDIRRGDTLEKFISEYAPKSENDTRKYINYVSSASGVQPYEKIPESKIPLVMAAIIQMEGGNESSVYYANSLRSGYSTGTRVAVATADTVTTSPPPLTVSTTNAPVATIPSAEDKPKVEQNVEAAIEAKVALGQVNIVQNQMVAAVGALNQKIVDVTKKTTTEFPFTSNPEAAISSYRA
jgi:hypothetical protein